MDNIYKQHLATLTQAQIELLHSIANKVGCEFPPFRNVDDADRLFDIHWLVAIRFLEIEIAESTPRQKLQVRLTIAGAYARSVLLNGGPTR